MSTRKVSIRFADCGSDAEVSVDGNDLTRFVRRLELDLGVGELGTCRLDLLATEVDAAVEVGKVVGTMEHLYPIRQHPAIHSTTDLRTGRRIDYAGAADG